MLKIMNQIKKIILYGVVIWAIDFVIGSLLIAIGMNATSWFFKILTLIILLVIVWIMTGKVEPKDAKSAIQLGLIWLAIRMSIIGILNYLIFNLVFAVKINPDFYRSWDMWTDYGLVLLIPWIKLQVKSK